MCVASVGTTGIGLGGATGRGTRAATPGRFLIWFAFGFAIRGAAGARRRGNFMRNAFPQIADREQPPIASDISEADIRPAQRSVNLASETLSQTNLSM